MFIAQANAGTNRLYYGNCMGIGFQSPCRCGWSAQPAPAGLPALFQGSWIAIEPVVAVPNDRLFWPATRVIVSAGSLEFQARTAT
jgi:hypothetical protein